MKILYSNSPKPNQMQTDPGKSLGGYLSSTPVLNGSLNNLFPSVSNQALNLKPFEVRMVGLYNESTINTHSGISLTFTIADDSIFKYYFSISTPTVDDCGDLYEILQNSQSLPYYSEFTEIESGVNYNISSLIAANNSLGLWLKREFKAKKKCKTSILLNSDDCDLWKAKYATLIADESCSEDNEGVDVFNISISFATQESSSSSSGSLSMG